MFDSLSDPGRYRRHRFRSPPQLAQKAADGLSRTRPCARRRWPGTDRRTTTGRFGAAGPDNPAGSDRESVRPSARRSRSCGPPSVASVHRFGKKMSPVRWISRSSSRLGRDVLLGARRPQRMVQVARALRAPTARAADCSHPSSSRRTRPCVRVRRRAPADEGEPRLAIGVLRPCGLLRPGSPRHAGTSRTASSSARWM